jgi:hypothetical protein
MATAICCTAGRDGREVRLVGPNPPGQASETPPTTASMGLGLVVAVAACWPAKDV